MPSTILSDNGVSSGSAGLKTTASNDGILALQTTTAGGTATNAIYVDTSQNVGIKTTPNAWGSSAISAQLSASALTCLSSTNTYLSHNAYVNSSSQNIYINSDYASLYRQNSGIHYWYTAASGSAGATISYTQSLSVGKAITLALEGATSQSGTGITFPATQSASSDANTLDDYEEGTWSPTASPNSGSIGGYTSSGTYTKVGRTVYATGNVYITGGGTAAGALLIGGLPFTSVNTTSKPSIPVCREDQSTGVIYSGYVNSNATSAAIHTLTNGGIVWSANYNYSFCFTYQTA